MFLCIWDNGFRGRKPTRNKEHPDRIQIAFDDHRLVNNPGLLLPATLAQRVGLRELVDHHLDLGDAPGRANAGDKMLTLAASALAGGDCIDDADVLRTGGTAGALGCVVNAPSTLGPSSNLGGLRNQVSRLRASRGNNSNVSGRSGGEVSCGNAGFPQLESAKVLGHMSRGLGKHVRPVQRQPEMRRQIRFRTRLPSGLEIRHPFLMPLGQRIGHSTAS